MVRINLVRPPRLEAVSFSRSDMQRIGLKARQQITERVTRGTGLNGRQMKPLSKKYREKKEKLGQPGIRNLQFSGSLLGAMTIVEVGADRVVIGFTRAAELAKAQKNQDRTPWFGLSTTGASNDEAVVLFFAERILQSKLAKLNMK